MTRKPFSVIHVIILYPSEEYYPGLLGSRLGHFSAGSWHVLSSSVSVYQTLWNVFCRLFLITLQLVLFSDISCFVFYDSGLTSVP